MIAPDGEQIGVKQLPEALWLAEQLGLDLVEVAPDAKPPVCRMMDYGKYKYEQSVRQREARKKQTKVSVKEVKFRTRIDDHDYGVKLDRALEFLGDGHKVKVIVTFFGREITHPELGVRLLEKMIEDVDGRAEVDGPPKREGRTMSMTLVPTKAPARQGELAEEQQEAVSEPEATEAETGS